MGDLRTGWFFVSWWVVGGCRRGERSVLTETDMMVVVVWMKVGKLLLCKTNDMSENG